MSPEPSRQEIVAIARLVSAFKAGEDAALAGMSEFDNPFSDADWPASTAWRQGFFHMHDSLEDD